VSTDLHISIGDDHVAFVELRRGPNNFFDIELIRSIDQAYAALDDDPRCRAIVLCAEGKHFCAGANLTGSTASAEELYAAALSMMSRALPVVAAVQGAAIGGGLGLALSADFRVACPAARLSANFGLLGFHHGFGLSVTLPRIVGHQHATDLLLTSRRISGDEAYAIGLCDRLVPAEDLRDTAHALAVEIAGSAPLAVRSIRLTLRAEMIEEVRAALERESHEQVRLSQTADYREGVQAQAQRRPPVFLNR
jgi:2-(1,2-epoxy-1,2-dihydrophenyl)acetyl-CoA isomerase